MDPEPFDPAAIEQAARAAPWVHRVVCLSETGSTNAEAMRLAASGEPAGLVVIADQQTAGRGRLGRTWWSEPGTALLVSWLLRPALPPERWPLLPLIAGLAAARGLGAAAHVEAKLKWPNDVLVDGRKVGGILAESDGRGALVIGLGVNLRQREFPEELRDRATSVVAEGGTPVQRAWLLAAVLSGFGARMDAPERSMDEYRAMCETIGRRVRVEREGADPLEGSAVEITDGGALVVETDGGRVPVSAGDVAHLRPA